MLNLPNDTQAQLDRISSGVKAPARAVKFGNCNRCGDFGELVKVPWTDPYTDITGFGWLDAKCANATKATAVRYNYPVNLGRRGPPNDGSHPIPKPKKKEKK